MRRPLPEPRVSPTFTAGGKFTRVPQTGGQLWLSDYYLAVASYADAGLDGDYLVYGTGRVLDVDYTSLYDDLVAALLAEGLIDRVFDPEPLTGECLIWGETGDALFGLVEDAYNVDYDCLKDRMIADGLGGASGEKYHGKWCLTIPCPQGDTLDYQFTLPYGGTIEHLRWSSGTLATTSLNLLIGGVTGYTSATWQAEADVAIAFATAATLQVLMTCTGWPGAAGHVVISLQEEPA